MPEKHESGDDADRFGKRLGAAAITALATVTERVIGRDSLPWERFVVLCCFGVVLITLVALGIPPFESLKQIICCVIAVATLAGMFSLRFTASTGPTQPEKKKLWPHFNAATFDRIAGTLEEARKLVYGQLQQLCTNLSDERSGRTSSLRTTPSPVR